VAGCVRKSCSSGLTDSVYRVLCAGIKCLAPRFVGRKLSSLTSNFAQTHRNFLGGQTRFMSPEVR
jgi:hypothetical protein